MCWRHRLAASPRRLYWGVLLAIVMLAAVVRVYDLDTLPPGLFCDEAALGYNAYSILKTGRDQNQELLPLSVWSFGLSYKNPIFIYVATVPIAAFGLNEFSVRLTAALFGVLGVIAITVLGRLMLGDVGSLLAALLLALVPWHVHFSRIAFELISFLPLFLFAFAALVTGVRGRPRYLLAAAVLFGLCLYAYGPAKLFVPVFLVGMAAVYWRRLVAVRRWALLAILLAAVTAAPAIIFDLMHHDRAASYFQATTTLNPAESAWQNSERVLRQYGRFFSPQFLFERGDPITRHAVQGFGELYVSMAPLLVFGLLWAIWPGHPEGKLLLWWLFLYPVAPSLMNEAPSASRGFIGVAAFCLLAAAGAVAALRTLRRAVPWARIAAGLQTLAVLVFLAVLAQEAWRYGHSYITVYPAAAARDFQYGYREAIEFMESRRSEYDLLLLTANDVNQPQIFTAFYNAENPRRWHRRPDAGYLIIDPAEYDRYNMNQRILAALREDDLQLFDEYTELHRVLTPSGTVEYVIAEPHARRQFVREWLLLGPFDNRSGMGAQVDFVAPDDVSQRSYRGVFGPTQWRPVKPQFVWVDFNSIYGPATAAAGRSTDWLCAYAVTQLVVDEPLAATLEFTGSHQQAQVWIDGRPLTTSPVRLWATPRRWPIQLEPGQNELLVKLCKTIGDWNFTARVTDSDGRDLPGVRVEPEIGPGAGGPSDDL